jgi:hypothetical protein
MTSVHTIAIIKGAVEGNPLLYIAAFGAVDVHARPALELGLIAIDDRYEEIPYVATSAGREFYIDANLASLPSGRANHWGHAADSALELLAAHTAHVNLRRQLVAALAHVSHEELAETVIEGLGVDTAHRLIDELT